MSGTAEAWYAGYGSIKLMPRPLRIEREVVECLAEAWWSRGPM